MGSDEAKAAVIRQRVLLGTVSNYAATLIMFGTWFWLTPFILHHLGATDYGLWIVVGSVVAYGSLLDLGIMGAVTKYLAEYLARGESDQAHELAATALCLYSLLGLLTVALSGVVAPVLPSLFNVSPDQRATASWLVLVMGVSVGVSIPCTIPLAILQGLQRYDLVSLADTMRTLASAAATVIVLLLGGGILGMAAVNVPVMLVMQVVPIWLITRITPGLRFGWQGASWQMARMIFSFSLPLSATGLARQLETKTDEVVIGAFLPINAVTPYALTRRLSEAAQALTEQFIHVLLPFASQLHAESDAVRLRLLYTAGTRLTLALFLMVGCPLIILAQPILTAWVGSEYASNAHLVVILTVAGLIATSQWPAVSILQGMARHRLVAVMSVGSALANLALSIALVHPFGTTGVALGTLLPTTAVSLGLMLPYAMRVLGVSAYESLVEIFLPALAPAVPMVIVLYVLRQVVEPASLLSLMAVVVPGMLLYMTGYLSIGAGALERQAYRRIAVSTLHFAVGRLKRP